tara:strand:- start:415 stop:2205 length:1791 start_codon:yes stop_codon:yes gene_type:complete
MPKIPSFISVGNTTFRRPWRVPEGLRVLEKLLSNYDFKTNRKSSQFETELTNNLSKSGVLDWNTSKDWGGRKFLAYCTQFGFIAPRPNNVRGETKYDLNLDGDDNNLINILSDLTDIKMEKKPFSLTPLGTLLKNTKSDGKELTAEQKDIFLRALFHHKQPSPIQKYSSKYDGEVFYPMKLFIDIIFDLEKIKEQPFISPYEMASIINRFKTNKTNQIIKEIVEYRKNKKGKESLYAEKWYEKYKDKNVKEKFDSSYAYVDINFNAMINTGIFKRKGRKLVIKNDEKEKAKVIASFEFQYEKETSSEYLNNLWSGNLLPVEDKALLLKDTAKVFQQLKSKYDYKNIEKIDETTNENVLKNLYYENKDRFKFLEEQAYYSNQKNKGKEILSILKDIQSRKREININGEIIKSQPHHLEWIIWRVFLAINNFIKDIKIKDTRNFPVDEDLVAEHHAISGHEDMSFEFDDYVLVVEPSFKTKRQQADEWEPVYNHTLKKSKETSKTVYTVFVAPEIEINTTNFFHKPIFDDRNEFYGNIISITIYQLERIFDSLFVNKKILTNENFKKFLDDCLNKKNRLNALQWHDEVNNLVDSFVNN